MNQSRGSETERGKVNGQLARAGRLNFQREYERKQERRGRLWEFGGKTALGYGQYTSSLGFQNNTEKRKT